MLSAPVINHIIVINTAIWQPRFVRPF